MPDAFTTVPSFIVRELEGARRRVTLSQRALPYGPVEFGRKQRVHIERYQGTRQGTSTVIGPDLVPTEVHGEWKEKYLNTGAAKVDRQTITETYKLVELFESISDSGSLLEVQWFRNTRRGHLTEFTPSWKNVNDVAWSMHFEWVGLGSDVAAPIVRAPTNTSAVGTALNTSVRSMQGTLDKSRLAVEPDRLAAIEDALGQVEQSVAQLQGGIDNALSRAMRPVDASRRAVSALSGIIGQATFLANEAMATPPLGMLSVATRVDPTTLGMGVRAAATLLQDRVAREARSQQREASITRADMLREMQDDLIGVHTAADGDTLRDVSARYYGSPNGWRDLLLFNHLTSAVLVRGQIVYVPRLGNGEGA